MGFFSNLFSSAKALTKISNGAANVTSLLDAYENDNDITYIYMSAWITRVSILDVVEENGFSSFHSLYVPIHGHQTKMTIAEVYLLTINRIISKAVERGNHVEEFTQNILDKEQAFYDIDEEIPIEQKRIFVDVAAHTPVDSPHHSKPHKRRFDNLDIINFMGFVIKDSTLPEIKKVLNGKGVSFHEHPDAFHGGESIVSFSYEYGGIDWDCRLRLENNTLKTVSINNYDSDCYHTYQDLCSELKDRYGASMNITVSRDKYEGTETTRFTNKSDNYQFTEIIYSSPTTAGVQSVYITYFKC